MTCPSPLSTYTDACHAIYRDMSRQLGYCIPLKNYDGFPFQIAFSLGTQYWKESTPPNIIPSEVNWKHFLYFAKLGLLCRYLCDKNNFSWQEKHDIELDSLTHYLPHFDIILKGKYHSTVEEFTSIIRDHFDVCWCQNQKTEWNVYNVTCDCIVEFSVTNEERYIAEMNVAGSLGYAFCDRKPIDVDDTIRRNILYNAKRERR